jgi:hypothetical protein
VTRVKRFFDDLAPAWPAALGAHLSKQFAAAGAAKAGPRTLPARTLAI